MTSRSDWGDDEITGTQFAARKMARHLRWVMRDGLGRLVEEDGLDVRRRAKVAAARWRWRRMHPRSRGALPVFLVGAQRSGTNMVARVLEELPEFEVHNENSRKAFVRFRIRDVAAIDDLVARSRHRFVLLKPLCDSHRVDELLAGVGDGRGRVIWLWRSVDERTRSAVAKFGESNLRSIERIARGEATEAWEGGGVSDETIALLRSFDVSELTAHDGAALFWFVRNVRFFDLGLDARDDVFLASYDDIVEDPARAFGELARFLGCTPPPLPVLRPRRPGRLDLHRGVRVACDELTRRLRTYESAARA